MYDNNYNEENKKSCDNISIERVRLLRKLVSKGVNINHNTIDCSCGYNYTFKTINGFNIVAKENSDTTWDIINISNYSDIIFCAFDEHYSETEKNQNKNLSTIQLYNIIQELLELPNKKED